MGRLQRVLVLALVIAAGGWLASALAPWMDLEQEFGLPWMYEAQGLVPGVARDAGGRRLYTEQHVGWLLLMDRLRRTGMSIAQMRQYTALVKQGKSEDDVVAAKPFADLDKKWAPTELASKNFIRVVYHSLADKTDRKTVLKQMLRRG